VGRSGGWSTGGVRCGGGAGDIEARRGVADPLAVACDCCTFGRLDARHCLKSTVRAAVESGALRRGCRGAALRNARTSCLASAVACHCTTDASCDDGNGCSLDRCVAGVCQHECLCVSPVGEMTCCPGPAASCPPVPPTTPVPRPCAACRYYLTCGWPVCPAPGNPFPFPTGAPPCTTEQAGAACADRDAICDPNAGCGELLRCT